MPVGIVTFDSRLNRLDLASHCRLLLHDRPKNPRAWRWLALYPLYVLRYAILLTGTRTFPCLPHVLLSEIAIIATDMAELLGSAIALCLIWPELPIWAGVLITAGDVILILALGDPLRGRPAKLFEWLIAGLVIAVLVCMVIIISKVRTRCSDCHLGS